jgi:predicted nucleic acid-binding protein
MGAGPRQPRRSAFTRRCAYYAGGNGLRRHAERAEWFTHASGRRYRSQRFPRFTTQYVIVEASARLIDHAAMLAQKHALRGYDAVQLAAALEVRAHIPSLTFLSADANLNLAALLELLSVDDPNNYP